jgi:hypothetical protein
VSEDCPLTTALNQAKSLYAQLLQAFTARKEALHVQLDTLKTSVDYVFNVFNRMLEDKWEEEGDCPRLTMCPSRSDTAKMVAELIASGKLSSSSMGGGSSAKKAKGAVSLKWYWSDDEDREGEYVSVVSDTVISHWATITDICARVGTAEVELQLSREAANSAKSAVLKAEAAVKAARDAEEAILQAARDAEVAAAAPPKEANEEQNKLFQTMLKLALAAFSPTTARKQAIQLTEVKFGVKLVFKDDA